jgi:hypothetical protein
MPGNRILRGLNRLLGSPLELARNECLKILSHPFSCKQDCWIAHRLNSCK